MDALSVVLVVALVAALAKDRIVAAVRKIANRKYHRPLWATDLLHEIGLVHSNNYNRHGETVGELNHIKGQLQDVSQELSRRVALQVQTRDRVEDVNNTTLAIETFLRQDQESRVKVYAKLQEDMKSYRSAEIEDFIALSGKHLTLLNELSEIRTTLQILQESRQQPQDTQAADIYLKSLAGLADGVNKTLERQEKIEKLLVQMVTVLNNKLTP